MDKTESTVRNMLTAIEAPLYDVGILSERGMLPGLDSIPAAAVLDRLSLLKYRNARGSHIYVRPSGEHRFTVLEPVINFGACDAGSQFLAIREAKSAAYLAYVLGASRAHLVKPSDFVRDKRQSGPWTSAALRPAVAASW
jgi:hypothetical protein